MHLDTVYVLSTRNRRGNQLERTRPRLESGRHLQSAGGEATSPDFASLGRARPDYAPCPQPTHCSRKQPRHRKQSRPSRHTLSRPSWIRSRPRRILFPLPLVSARSEFPSTILYPRFTEKAAPQIIRGFPPRDYNPLSRSLCALNPTWRVQRAFRL